MKKILLKNKLFYYFYKLLKIYRNKKPSLHFAEFGEDIFINRILKHIKYGKYVDVGCYHPYKGSLTAILYNKNWDGINIDISKTSIDLFNIVRKRDMNLNVAISNFDGEISYYENSPINQQNSLTKKNNEQNKIKIKCQTLNSIFDVVLYGDPILQSKGISAKMPLSYEPSPNFANGTSVTVA